MPCCVAASRSSICKGRGTLRVSWPHEDAKSDQVLAMASSSYCQASCAILTPWPAPLFLLNQSCIPSSLYSITAAVSLSPQLRPLRARVILHCSAPTARRRACSLMHGATTRAARDQSRERIRMPIRCHYPPARPCQHETAQQHTPSSSLVSHTRYAAIKHSRHTLPLHARAPAHLRPTRFPASTSPRCKSTAVDG